MSSSFSSSLLRCLLTTSCHKVLPFFPCSTGLFQSSKVLLPVIQSSICSLRLHLPLQRFLQLSFLSGNDEISRLAQSLSPSDLIHSNIPSRNSLPFVPLRNVRMTDPENFGKGTVRRILENRLWTSLRNIRALQGHPKELVDFKKSCID